MTRNHTSDEELIAQAKDVIAQRYRDGFHHLGSAVRASSGNIYVGIHLEADVGRASVCAEAVALGAALQAVPVSSLLFGRYRRNTGVIV